MRRTILLICFLFIIFLFPQSAFAVSLQTNPNHVIESKSGGKQYPVDFYVSNCPQSDITAIRTQKDNTGKPLFLGPIFAIIEDKPGKRWHGNVGTFTIGNDALYAQQTLEHTGAYKLRVACKLPNDGTTQKLLSDLIGGTDHQPDSLDYFTTKFWVVTETAGGTTQKEPAKPQPVCELKDGRCIGVNTGLGQINPDPVEVVSIILRYLLGISGGLFLLIFIRAGYRMITSQGNPEAIKEARESITSAVVGFIFLLFSFIVLEIIGVDLFQLPGFNP